MSADRPRRPRGATIPLKSRPYAIVMMLAGAFLPAFVLGESWPGLVLLSCVPLVPPLVLALKVESPVPFVLSMLAVYGATLWYFPRIDTTTDALEGGCLTMIMPFVVLLWSAAVAVLASFFDPSVLLSARPRGSARSSDVAIPTPELLAAVRHQLDGPEEPDVALVYDLLGKARDEDRTIRGLRELTDTYFAGRIGLDEYRSRASDLLSKAG